MDYIDDLRQREDQAQLWQAQVRGYHLWMILRNEVLNDVIKQREGFQTAHVVTKRLQRISPNLLSYHLQTLKQWLTDRHQPIESLIFKKARNYNIYKYYYEQLPHPLIIEESWKNNLSVDLWQQQTTALWDTFKIVAGLLRRTIDLTPQEQRTIADFAHHVAKTYDMQAKVERYRGHLERSIQSAIVIRRLLEHFIIPRMRGKLALIHQAYYLGAYGIITHTLRQHGIRVAEPQHGVIYKGHAAYTFSDAAVTNPNHPIHQYRPDVLLTFGDLWTQAIIIPGETYTIGYPHLMKKVAQQQQQPDGRKVLIVSQGTLSNVLGPLTERIASAYPDYHFIYKLHPEEIGFEDRYPNLRQLANVTVVDYQSDIHDFLVQCQTVIGFSSTVMFEAAAYHQRRILILDDGLFSREILSRLGTVYDTPDDLLASFGDTTQNFSNDDASYIWHPHWRDNIANFVAQYTS